jgi:hypothetical protein
VPPPGPDGAAVLVGVLGVLFVGVVGVVFVWVVLVVVFGEVAVTVVCGSGCWHRPNASERSFAMPSRSLERRPESTVEGSAAKSRSVLRTAASVAVHAPSPFSAAWAIA